jgi:transposase-like protein
MAKKITRVRRTVTPQFQRDAVALISDGRSLTEVAHDLGIARSLLQHWQNSCETYLRSARHSPVPVDAARRMTRCIASASSSAPSRRSGTS